MTAGSAKSDGADSVLAIDQAAWDQVRFSLLRELSLLTVPEELSAAFQAMLVALTDAYDRPLPNDTVYRQLRTFQVARWPLLRNLLHQQDSVTVDTTALLRILQQVTTMAQHATKAAAQYQVDSLEIDMEVLSQLLEANTAS